MQKILLSGGTGLIGSGLVKLLKENNYEVSILTRNPDGNAPVKQYKWNIADSYIDDEALIDADFIIHLAGAGIADKPWTPERKRELYTSRINSTNLLYQRCKELRHFPKAFLSASGISIYGINTGEIPQQEDQKELGTDFLAELCKDWEAAALQFETSGTRVVCFRTSVVLAKNSGALPKMALPARFGLASPLGKGEQYMSWIHIEDLCRMYLFAIKNNISGVYNAASSHPVTNKTFMKYLADTYSRPFFLPNIPAFVLKLIFGEMSKVVLGGNNTSNEKILKEGFDFYYTNLNSALKNLLKEA